MSRRSPVRSSWASILLVLISFVMLAWTFKAGRDLGMADSLSKISWARAQFTVAVAISRLAYGAKGYALYNPVWYWLNVGGFRGNDAGEMIDANAGIASALGHTLNIDCGPDYVNPCMFDWGDEKGYADFVIAAFALFGFNVQALYYLYFLILSISLTAFCIQFFRDPAFLVLAPFVLAGHYVAVLVLPDSLVTSVVHDARFVSAVALLASLHLAILVTRKKNPGLSCAPLLLVQLAIIVLALDSRSSAIWLILIPVAAFLISLLRQRSKANLTRALLTRGPVVALVLCSPLLLSAYKNATYDQRYTVSGVQSHVVWHALYMGLGISPSAETYGLKYDDTTSYLAAYRYLLNHPDYAERLHVNMQSIAFDPEDVNIAQSWVLVVGWHTYEEIVRAAYLDFVQAHPWYTAATFAIYKPLYLAQQLLWQTTMTDYWPAWVNLGPLHLPSKRDPLAFFSPAPAMAVFLSALIAFLTGAARPARWLGLCGLLFIASLVPSIAVAPIYYELPVVFATLTTLFYALLAAVTVLLLHHARRLLVKLRPLPAYA